MERVTQGHAEDTKAEEAGHRGGRSTSEDTKKREATSNKAAEKTLAIKREDRDSKEADVDLQKIDKQLTKSS